ncbi:MAG: hypothetical protein ACYTBJ_05375 [Planctomycetota bacterium]|jgi:hypothetical protein
MSFFFGFADEIVKLAGEAIGTKPGGAGMVDKPKVPGLLSTSKQYGTPARPPTPLRHKMLAAQKKPAAPKPSHKSAPAYRAAGPGKYRKLVDTLHGKR